jgi:phosphoribosylaminoimidazole-succinocarboxamide synthase
MKIEESAKNLWVEHQPTEDEFGVGILEFRDDFSVFDYGKMPQTIPGKGEALKKETVHWFGLLEENGIRTHFVEDLGERGIRIKVSRKLGYTEIDRGSGNYMLPIEIIFRNKIHPASSLHRRLMEEEVDEEKLRMPMVEFSTKLEPVDRYIDEETASELAGLTREEMEEVRKIALRVNGIITKNVGKLDHIDGKIEMALGPERDLYVCDAVGTPDENRFLYKGLDLSKQMIRDYYKRNGWYDELLCARKEGREAKKPPLMEEGFLFLVSDAYRSLCVEITGEAWSDAPPIEEVVERYDDWLKGCFI